jgi:hypothetical protein
MIRSGHEDQQKYKTRQHDGKRRPTSNSERRSNTASSIDELDRLKKLRKKRKNAISIQTL